ncbi:MAG: LamG domain-containing protein [Pirellulaceae bacterium]
MAAPLVTGDLTLYFDFEDLVTTDLVGAGATARLLDQSGNDYGLASTHEVGEVHEGDEFDVDPGTFELGPGILGQGGVFSQSSDGLDLPVYVTVDGAHLSANHFDSIPAGTNKSTYAAWVKTTTDSHDQSVFQGRAGPTGPLGGSGHGNPHFQLQGGGDVRMVTRSQDGKTNADYKGPVDGAGGSGVYPVDEWFHVAWTYDAADGPGTLKAYYNGVEIATSTCCGSAESDNTIGDWAGREAFGDFFAAGFGAVYDSGGRRLEGTIDELYVFNRALSAEEIGTLHGLDEGPDADLNQDGFVDGLDLGILLGDWNPPPVPGAAVPEPTSIALLALSSLSLLITRRKRS